MKCWICEDKDCGGWGCESGGMPIMTPAELMALDRPRLCVYCEQEPALIGRGSNYCESHQIGMPNGTRRRRKRDFLPTGKAWCDDCGEEWVEPCEDGESICDECAEIRMKDEAIYEREVCATYDQGRMDCCNEPARFHAPQWWE